MTLPTLDITGNLTRELDTRFAQSGTCIAAGTIAANKSKRLDNGDWETTDTLFQNFTVFGTLAEELANLAKGAKLRLIGTLRTEQWEDKNTGEKRSANKLIVDFAHVYRDRESRPQNQRQQGGNWGQQGQSQGGGWGQPAGGDEPPF